MVKQYTLNKCAQTFALFLILLTLSACENEPSSDKPYTLVGDQKVQALLNAVDERNTEAFLPFLQHPESDVKALAILHAASFKDSTIIPALFELKTPEAVYAIGQQRSNTNLPGLYEIVMLESDAELVESAFTAIAKSADSAQVIELLPYLIPSCNINPMWAAFHAIPSGAVLQPLVPVAFEQLTCENQDFRMAAAHFLSRSKSLLLTSFADELFDAWNSETDIEVKIALSLAFRNCPNPETAGFLNREVLIQGDERVRVNLLRSAIALNACEEEILIQLLEDEGTGMAMLAGSELGKIGWTEENNVSLQQLELGFEGTMARAKAELLHSLNDEQVYNKLIELAALEANPYRKSAILNVLSNTPVAANYIALHIDSSLPKVIQTTAIDALFNMKSAGLLPRSFNFNTAIQEGIATQDEGVLAAIGAYLQQADASDFKDEEEILREQLPYLEIPKEVETYNELVKAINHLYTDSLATITPEYNHPIEWNLLSLYGDTVQVELQTTTGKLQVELYSAMAPGSVASFLRLALDGFYDGKYYHRVVPNFVIQAGCPRGDGWGGVDYSIRSELALERYQTGSIGMASAGRDTESCQWFITHSPTPHLDGRYTIFGQVIAGMDAVRRTEVGTKIEKVVVKNP